MQAHAHKLTSMHKCRMEAAAWAPGSQSLLPLPKGAWAALPSDSRLLSASVQISSHSYTWRWNQICAAHLKL